MIDIDKIINNNKKGVVCITTPRSGGHFLIAAIKYFPWTRNTNSPNELTAENQAPGRREQYQHDSYNPEVYDLSVIHKEYNYHPLLLLNNMDLITPFDSKDADELCNWYTIKITRKYNKITHFISWYLWSWLKHTEFQNDPDNLTKLFRHHGTPNAIYCQLKPKVLPIYILFKWIDQQLTFQNLPIQTDAEIDYSELPTLNTLLPKSLIWENNDYSELTLEKLFINFEEITKHISYSLRQ
jgi:hypothetical protein